MKRISTILLALLAGTAAMAQQQAQPQTPAFGEKIDVNGGYVADVKMFIDLDVEMTVKDPDTKIDLPVPAGGTMELSFKRLTNLGSR